MPLELLTLNKETQELFHRIQKAILVRAYGDIELMIQYKDEAVKLDELAKAVDQHGNTLLHYMCMGNLLGDADVKGFADFAEKLFAAGVEMNVINKQQQTPLDIANIKYESKFLTFSSTIKMVFTKEHHDGCVNAQQARVKSLHKLIEEQLSKEHKATPEEISPSSVSFSR